MRRVSAILCLVGLTGCPSIGSYQCQQDEDCNRNGEAGQCLPDAACAYPEPGGRCESGWARSPNAAESPGACIDAEQPVSTGGSSGISTTGSESSASVGSSDSSTSAPPCALAHVSIDTATFSPGVGLSSFALWVPFTGWPKGIARLDAGDGLLILDGDGNALPYESRALLDGTPALWIALPEFEADDVLPLQFNFVPDYDGATPASVWQDDYIGVWHLDDAPMGLDGDVTRNALVTEEPGVMAGSMQPDQLIAGPLGPALAFDGDDDSVDITASFVGQLDAYTISLWIRAAPDNASIRGSFFQRLNGDLFYPRCWHGTEKTGRMFCQQSVGGTTNGASTVTDLPVDEFTHFALSRDPESGVTSIYIHGEVVSSFTDEVGEMLDTDKPPRPFQLGYGEWGALLGALDEVRVSDRVLSPNRVRADYRSQGGELEITTFGPLEASACPL